MPKRNTKSYRRRRGGTGAEIPAFKVEPGSATKTGAEIPAFKVEPGSNTPSFSFKPEPPKVKPPPAENSVFGGIFGTSSEKKQEESSSEMGEKSNPLQTSMTNKTGGSYRKKSRRKSRKMRKRMSRRGGTYKKPGNM